MTHILIVGSGVNLSERNNPNKLVKLIDNVDGLVINGIGPLSEDADYISRELPLREISIVPYSIEELERVMIEEPLDVPRILEFVNLMRYMNPGIEPAFYGLYRGITNYQEPFNFDKNPKSFYRPKKDYIPKQKPQDKRKYIRGR